MSRNFIRLLALRQYATKKGGGSGGKHLPHCLLLPAHPHAGGSASDARGATAAPLFSLDSSQKWADDCVRDVGAPAHTPPPRRYDTVLDAFQRELGKLRVGRATQGACKSASSRQHV